MDKNKVIIAKYHRFHVHTNSQPQILEGEIVSRDKDVVRVKVDGKETVVFGSDEFIAKSLFNIYKMFSSMYELNGYTHDITETHKSLEYAGYLLTTLNRDRVVNFRKGVDDLIECYSH